MRDLAAGNAEALGVLHGRHAARVFARAARRLGGDGAEEIVQEVFLAVWRHAACFDARRGAFSAWIDRITRTRILNELRRRGRRPRLTGETSCLAATDSQPEPDEAAWLAHRRAIVRAAVDALPPHQSRALRLAFLEELSQAQVAAFLEVPLGTAKGRIRAGLETLRQRLAGLAAAGMIVIGLLIVLGVHEQAQRASLARERRALRLVTSSDVSPRRLTAAPGAPAAAHGNYRSRPGTPLAVLTVSHLAQPPGGRQYAAWAGRAGRWILLGTVHPDALGSGLLIAEGAELAAPPEALVVTLEPTAVPRQPTGRAVIAWPAPR